MSAIAAARKPKRIPKHKDSIWMRFWKTRFLFLLWLPGLIHLIMVKYIPMWGIILSFVDYNVFLGWEGSTWVGLRNFEAFFNSPDFWLVTKNTFVLGVQGMLITFPITVFFALLLNEIRSAKFKKVVQTVSYLPYFLSSVVICGMVNTLLDLNGGINLIIKACGGEAIYFMLEKDWFRPVYHISGLWAGLGWGSILYLAAISGVDPTLYEAARLDGAGRWRQMWNITLPSIAPTVTTMFILSIGNIMDGALEKTLLLQQPITYEVSQVIVTYIYQVGLGASAKMNFGLSTAVSLYSNVINLALLIIANWLCKKFTENSVF